METFEVTWKEKMGTKHKLAANASSDGSRELAAAFYEGC